MDRKGDFGTFQTQTSCFLTSSNGSLRAVKVNYKHARATSSQHRGKAWIGKRRKIITAKLL